MASKLSSLLKGKSVPNLPSYSTPWSKHDEKLWNAIKQQSLKHVKSALAKPSVTPTKLGPQGKSAFHLACEIGNEPIIDVILASTQDVNDTTLQATTRYKLVAAEDLPLNKTIYLMVPGMGGGAVIYNVLTAKQANVDQRDCDGMTALHHACFWQHQDCVKVLLLKNADVNAVEQSGKTPLFYSSHLGHVEICRWLLDKGAKVNCQDKDNVTPLMLAAKEGHLHVCELLMRSGANPELTDRHGKTAMHYAKVFNRPEVLEALGRQHNKISSDQKPSDGNRDYSRATPEDKPRSSCEEAPPPDDGIHLSNWSNPYFLNIDRYDESDVSTDDYINNIVIREDIEDVGPRNQLALAGEETVPKTVYNIDEIVPKAYVFVETVPKTVYNVDETVPKTVYSVDETVPKTVYNVDETVPKLAYKMDETAQKEAHKVDETVPKGVYTKESVADNDSPIDGSTCKPMYAQEKMKQEMSYGQEAMEQDTDMALDKRLKDIMYMPKKSSAYANSQHLLEKEQLEKQITQLKEQLDKQQHKATVDEEKLLHQNKSLTKEVESLRQDVASLKEELEVAKNEAPTDAQRLDAILDVSRNFEEVNFDEEGFVEGRDMTKEEFLQAQNQQLKIQCGRLTEELEKLRLTFDAILKAGDNLQADYDHLAMEKDALQDELEGALKEKRDIVAENEFLIADNNELHENLKKIVHELEKMQEKYQTAQSENEELKRSVAVASKVGEVARLLEERDVLQQKCTDFEDTSQKLQHDHDILVEEVQSLNESVNQLTGQRNQLVSDLEEMETFYQQHETLQAEYNQLEIEFAELLKDKETLEQQLSSNNEVKEETGIKVSGESFMEASLKQLAAEKQQLENEKQELQGVVNGLTRHIVAAENKVKDLEKNLEQLRASQVSHKVNISLERNGIEEDEDENNKGNEVKTSQEEIINLKKQIIQLNQEVEEWEKKHEDTVSTYRTHLLSAVQGHMDPDVKDALYHIIELRSMEQFC